MKGLKSWFALAVSAVCRPLRKTLKSKTFKKYTNFFIQPKGLPTKDEILMKRHELT